MEFFNNKKSNDEIIIAKALKTSEELLEHLDGTVRWLLYFCEKNNIPIPNYEQLVSCIDRSQYLLQRLNLYQPTFNTNNDQPSSEQNQKNHLLYNQFLNKICRKTMPGSPSLVGRAPGI
jgi:hypothetical protein